MWEQLVFVGATEVRLKAYGQDGWTAAGGRGRGPPKDREHAAPVEQLLLRVGGQLTKGLCSETRGATILARAIRCSNASVCCGTVVGACAVWFLRTRNVPTWSGQTLVCADCDGEYCSLPEQHIHFPARESQRFHVVGSSAAATLRRSLNATSHYVGALARTGRVSRYTHACVRAPCARGIPPNTLSVHIHHQATRRPSEIDAPHLGQRV